MCPSVCVCVCVRMCARRGLPQFTVADGQVCVCLTYAVVALILPMRCCRFAVQTWTEQQSKAAFTSWRAKRRLKRESGANRSEKTEQPAAALFAVLGAIPWRSSFVTGLLLVCAVVLLAGLLRCRLSQSVVISGDQRRSAAMSGDERR